MVIRTTSPGPSSRRKVALRATLAGALALTGVVALAGDFNPKALEARALKRGDLQTAQAVSGVKMKMGFKPTLKLTPPEAGAIAGMTIEREEEIGQARRIRGRSVIAGAQTPREAAEGFLRAHRDVLGLSANLAE